MRNTVRRYQSINTEVSIMELLTIISSIQKAFFSPNCMVTPLPYKAAAHPVIAVNPLKIVLQIAGAISHGMAVFAHHKGKILRKNAPLRFFKILPNFLKLRIHTAVNIHMTEIILLHIRYIACALIMAEPCIVPLLRPCHGRFKRTAIGAFISHGPDHHAGSVLIPLYTAFYTVQNRLCICRIICKQPVPLLHMSIPVICFFKDLIRSMALIIRLIHHIKPHLIKQMVILRTVRIMTGADGIYIVLLHQAQILFHLCPAYSKTCIGITVMTIYTVKFNRCPVDMDHAFLYTDLTDPKTVSDILMTGTQFHSIKQRCFGCPA